MKHIRALDSLRGLAAVVVVLHHCAMTKPGLHEWLDGTYVLRPFIAGPSAVYVFFVLSGLVLYLTFEGKDGFYYPSYLAKRITRIWLPLVAAVLLSAMLYIGIRPQPIASLSLWFNDRSWSEFPSAKLILGHLLPLNPWRYQTLDNVIWSLVHELRISIIFPFIALTVRYDTRVALGGSLAIVLASFYALDHNMPGVIVQMASTMRYVLLFAVGAAIARHRDRVQQSWATPLGRYFVYVAVGVGLTLVSLQDDTLLTDLLISSGAILLVGVALSCDLDTILHKPILIWIGKVSYSLYLLHVLVLLTIVHLCYGRLPTIILLITVPLLSLIVAGISFRFIERPSMEMGRRIAGRLQQYRFE